MSIGGNDYIPSNNFVFCDFTETMLKYAVINYDRWDIGAPPDFLLPAAELRIAAQLCDSPQSTHGDIVKRNALRKALEKEVRDFLQGHIMHNKKVTNVDRAAMDLPSGNPKRVYRIWAAGNCCFTCAT